MPANLPPQYYEAKRRFELSKDIDEKIAILQEMIAIMPKHKGTNKLLGDLKSRLASLKREALAKPSKRKSYNSYHIIKQGAAQIVVIGFSNVGKSSLVASLTNVDTQIAPYPFTTDKPVVGMMPFEDINMQLIDTPPITKDYIDPHLLELLRRVDLIMLVIDISTDDALDQIESITSRLEEYKLKLTADEVQEIDEFIYKKAVLIANKIDIAGSEERLDILNELYRDKLTVFPFSAQLETDFKPLKEYIFEILNIIRVYTKPVGKKADLTDPIILHNGSTVIDAALEIHKDFFENLKFAKIWGDKEGKYNGQRVGRDHPLEDGNILEFHIPD